MSTESRISQLFLLLLPNQPYLRYLHHIPSVMLKEACPMFAHRACINFNGASLTQHVVTKAKNRTVYSGSIKGKFQGGALNNCLYTFTRTGWKKTLATAIKLKEKFFSPLNHFQPFPLAIQMLRRQRSFPHSFIFHHLLKI